MLDEEERLGACDRSCGQELEREDDDGSGDERRCHRDHLVRAVAHEAAVGPARRAAVERRGERGGAAGELQASEEDGECAHDDREREELFLLARFRQIDRYNPLDGGYVPSPRGPRGGRELEWKPRGRAAADARRVARRVARRAEAVQRVALRAVVVPSFPIDVDVDEPYGERIVAVPRLRFAFSARRGRQHDGRRHEAATFLLRRGRNDGGVGKVGGGALSALPSRPAAAASPAVVAKPVQSKRDEARRGGGSRR